MLFLFDTSVSRALHAALLGTEEPHERVLQQDQDNDEVLAADQKVLERNISDKLATARHAPLSEE